ncbi:MAG: RnfABCDGE type electron transport complex subunit D [Elusimicrobia bacterium]|nr:RnfABCDGE type electron transport complex subunit D [Elusimicrobiota bacterium]MBU2615237.1 RnfABCDGE type electron transport complex subunit D [Elusimicrobiota bacterium]
MNPLFVSVSPHIRSEKTIRHVMLDVLFALLPSVIAGVIFFGKDSLLIVSTSVLFCCLTEIVFEKIAKRKNTINDLSAVVTGIIFSLTLPASAPLWIVACGAVFAILIGKQFFGGIGHNPFNPALIARAFVQLSWSKEIAGIPASLEITKFNMFLGNMPGALGEVSKIAIIAGALYLIFRRQITLHAPLSLVVTVVLLSIVTRNNPLFQVLTGGLLLGAVFMATDPVTTPVSGNGKIIFGIGCGLLTMLIRLKGAFPEGIYYSILIMNMFTPVIDKVTRKKGLGSDEFKNTY